MTASAESAAPFRGHQSRSAKYRAALGTPRELGRENAYLSAAMDPSDARHAAMKAKGIHTRAQAHGTPAFPKTSSTSYSPELQREYPVMTKHAALLSILKTASAHEDKRHEKIAVIGSLLRGARGLATGLAGGTAPAAAAAGRASAALTRGSAAAARSQEARAALIASLRGKAVDAGSDLHKQLMAMKLKFKPMSYTNVPTITGNQVTPSAERLLVHQQQAALAAARKAQGVARHATALVPGTRRAQQAYNTVANSAQQRGYGAGQAVRTGAKNLWGQGQAAMGTAAIRGQQLAGQGIQGAQQALGRAGSAVRDTLGHPAAAGLAGAGAMYGLNKMGSDRHEKIAALSGVLRGASGLLKNLRGRGLLKNLPGALGLATGTGGIPSRAAATALRRGVPGVPGPADAAAYGLRKMGSAELALVKIAARIINADAGLDAIIAHIKAAKARQGVLA